MNLSPDGCNEGEGGDDDAVFILSSGATLKNVIIGSAQTEGVHCLGPCTIQNVWWEDVCEDALSIKQTSGTSYVIGGGARHASDKGMAIAPFPAVHSHGTDSLQLSSTMVVVLSMLRTSSLRTLESFTARAETAGPSTSAPLSPLVLLLLMEVLLLGSTPTMAVSYLLDPRFPPCRQNG